MRSSIGNSSLPFWASEANLVEMFSLALRCNSSWMSIIKIQSPASISGQSSSRSSSLGSFCDSIGLHSGGHLLNFRSPVCQSILGLCLTSHSWPINISAFPKLVTAKFNVSTCPLIVILRSTYSEIGPPILRVPSVLYTGSDLAYCFVFMPCF